MIRNQNWFKNTEIRFFKKILSIQRFNEIVKF